MKAASYLEISTANLHLLWKEVRANNSSSKIIQNILHVLSNLSYIALYKRTKCYSNYHFWMDR